MIVFQYNPWHLSRSLQPRTTGEVDKGEALRLGGPPEETFEVRVRCVTHTIERGGYTQSFALTREGLGSLLPVLPT